MKRKLLMAVTAIAVLGSSMTVCAAPQYMADGSVFDAEWYLEQNPDVKANWSLGTSADALYQHYTMYGASEGRQPYNAATLDPANILPYQPAAEAPTTPEALEAPTAQEAQQTDQGKIFAEAGVEYSFPSIRSDKYNNEPCTAIIKFENLEADQYSLPDALQPYAQPGYEWRCIKVAVTTSEMPSGVAPLSMASLTARADHTMGYTLGYGDNYKAEAYFQAIDKNGWITHFCDFTSVQNGKGGKLFFESAGAINDYRLYYWYALVPQGFDSSGLYPGHYGMKMENGKAVKNEASPNIYYHF